MHILILAGGGGTRLWPLSREDFPKQFLQFGDSQSLLQKTVQRFTDLPIAISTNQHYEELVRQQIGPHHQIIVEPSRKNTAPAIAYSLKFLQETMGLDEEAPFLVLPSDHWIEPQELFMSYVEKVEPLVKKGQLVLFGIQPTKAETGYGYIRCGEPFDPYTVQVDQFVEKPDALTAEQYVQSGKYLWNSGIFCFTLKVFWQQLRRCAPEIAELMEGNMEEVKAHFDQMPNLSFDYAVLEKCAQTLVCPLPVIWSDVGSWDNVYDLLDKDQNHNVKQGNVVEIDTKNSLIIGSKRLISTIGLSDLLIVETDDAIFISKKGQSQKVKEMVQELVKIGKQTHRTKIEAWGKTEVLDETRNWKIMKMQIDPHKTWIAERGRVIPLEGGVPFECEAGKRIQNETDVGITFLFIKGIDE